MLPAMRLIDLSVPLQDGAVSEPLPAQIDYVTHGPHGFYVSCLPVKIERASAAWCRAVALVPTDS